MRRIIIADTSVLIIFDKINKLDILKRLYHEIFITIQLDKGEASVIALAIENKNATSILDDLRARKYAKRLGINVTGTLGVINKAKEKGIIKNIKPIIELLSKTLSFIFSVLLLKIP